MAELEQRELETPVSTSSPVTSTTPATKPAKNPKRVAAGKLAAEKTKQAREAQKKASIEAAAIIAKEKEKKSAAAKRNVTPPAVTEPAPPEAQPQSSGLTTNQWISLLGIGVAIVTTYVKREDIKAFINEKRSPTFKAPPTLITDDTPVTAESLAAGIGWAAKKVVKENFTSDPSSSFMNYVKFTAVMAGSVALKQYLEDQKILPTN
ncbi:hypothetical protein ACROYT_G015290 [Oculina patagonica]